MRPGLWLSQDNGATWQAFEELPFKNIMRVEFVPGEEGIIYLATFGGSVWKGREEPGAGR
ncbi:MAG TPA: hypothetical protein PK280_17270 [Planctomycetota bacterium]|nr:hypothetical protein [Planctomycetota bacterium]